MASAYKDYERDVEGEIQNVLDHNLSITREHLIITATGIEFTEEGQEILDRVARDRAAALKEGLPFKEPIHKDRVVNEKNLAKQRAAEIEEDAEKVREAEERDAKAEEEAQKAETPKVGGKRQTVKPKAETKVEEEAKQE